MLKDHHGRVVRKPVRHGEMLGNAIFWPWHSQWSRNLMPAIATYREPTQDCAYQQWIMNWWGLSDELLATDGFSGWERIVFGCVPTEESTRLWWIVLDSWSYKWSWLNSVGLKKLTGINMPVCYYVTKWGWGQIQWGGRVIRIYFIHIWTYHRLSSIEVTKI